MAYIDKYGVAFTDDKKILLESPFNTFKEQDYVVPDNVEEISNLAFFGCKSLSSVSIPEGVVKIHKGAFADCTSLSMIVLPDSVREIEVGAFENCRGLKEIIVPAGEELRFRNMFWMLGVDGKDYVSLIAKR